MDFVRMSVLPREDLLQTLIEKEKTATAVGSKATPEEDFKTNEVTSACANRCVEILPLLVNKTFQSKYWTTPPGLPDCYVFSHRSSRCIVLEVVTRFPNSQMENLHSYKFVNHPMFEEKLNALTRNKGNEKPNQNLVRSRTWDVALNVVMKIEALPLPYNRSRYLLKREYTILDFIWRNYIQKQMEIDEMTGIPMVFEYVEVPNDTFIANAFGYQVDELSEFGKMKRLEFPNNSETRTTLSYMTMEKLGPSISYLQQLVRAANVKLSAFDLWTALKVFDQIVCRILQIQRFGVVHNDICPENVYMGHGVGFDVVYLNNYKRAYIIAEGEKEGPTGLADTSFGCNIRFASLGQLSGSARQMRPIDDIESAFYVLMSLLTADTLPWDSCMRQRPVSEFANSSNQNDNEQKPKNTHNATPSDEKTFTGDVLRKVQEFKQRFWQSNQIINMVLSKVHCAYSGDELQAANVTGLMRDIYVRVKEWRQSAAVANPSDFCAKLSRPSSEEFRQFMELRKCALIHFQFSEAFDIINDITFRKKVANHVQKDGLPQQPWNSVVWCFNNIEIRTDNKKSMMASSSVGPVLSSSSSKTGRKLGIV